jgi:hypothetical protein
MAVPIMESRLQEQTASTQARTRPTADVIAATPATPGPPPEPSPSPDLLSVTAEASLPPTGIQQKVALRHRAVSLSFNSPHLAGRRVFSVRHPQEVERRHRATSGAWRPRLTGTPSVALLGSLGTSPDASATGLAIRRGLSEVQ